MHASHRHSVGFARREFIQVGFSGLLGLGLSDLLAAQTRAGTIPDRNPAQRAPARAKSVILVFLTGGLSHLDSFDMKPSAPAGIRGEFQPIATSVSGIQFCEHLPQLAARADKLAIVRSLSHKYTNHLNATHEVLTGQSQPGAFFDKIASRDDYPCYAATIDKVRPRRWDTQRRDAPNLSDGGTADLAGTARGFSRSETRPMAGSPGSQSSRIRL